MLHVAPEVEEALDEGGRRRLRDSAAGSFKCPQCGASGDFAIDDASAIAIVTSHQVVVRYAHTSCASSQVVHAPDDEPWMPDDVRTLAALILPPNPGQGAVLLMESTATVIYEASGGDTVNAFLTAWQQAGAQLLLSADQRPARVKGARLHLDPATGTGGLQIDGNAWLDELPPLPPGWAQTAIRSQSVTVYVGDGLGLRGMAESAVNSMDDLLGTAISRGNVVALKAAVVKRPATARRTPEQVAAKQLHGELEAMMQQRARPGSSDGFNGVPDVVAFTRRPRLVQTLANEFPVLIIDIDPADRGALRTLTSPGMGFASVYDLDRPLADASGTWQFLLWRSQIAILLSDAEQRRKLLFDAFDSAGNWYDLVRDYSKMPMVASIGLLIGPIGITSDTSLLDDLNAAMARGDVAGGALHGMLASD